MKKLTKKLFKKFGFKIENRVDESNLEALYQTYKTYTMIPQAVYIENLKIVQKHALAIKGDIVECGVWRGGMIGGIASLVGKNRSYHLFDSFEGLPVAAEIDGVDALAWQQNTEGENYHENCTAEIQYAEKAMQLSGVSAFALHKGWFNATLPNFRTSSPIAVLRLDGDWYDSTMDCLTNLYPLVNDNGLIIIDDYFAWDGCSKAVHDYLSAIKSASRIYSSAGVCYIIKKDKYNAQK